MKIYLFFTVVLSFINFEIHAQKNCGESFTNIKSLTEAFKRQSESIDSACYVHKVEEFINSNLENLSSDNLQELYTNISKYILKDCRDSIAKSVTFKVHSHLTDLIRSIPAVGPNFKDSLNIVGSLIENSSKFKFQKNLEKLNYLFYLEIKNRYNSLEISGLKFLPNDKLLEDLNFQKDEIGAFRDIAEERTKHLIKNYFSDNSKSDFSIMKSELESAKKSVQLFTVYGLSNLYLNQLQENYEDYLVEEFKVNLVPTLNKQVFTEVQKYYSIRDSLSSSSQESIKKDINRYYSELTASINLAGLNEQNFTFVEFTKSHTNKIPKELEVAIEQFLKDYERVSLLDEEVKSSLDDPKKNFNNYYESLQEIAHRRKENSDRMLAKVEVALKEINYYRRVIKERVYLSSNEHLDRLNTILKNGEISNEIINNKIRETIKTLENAK